MVKSGEPRSASRSDNSEPLTAVEQILKDALSRGDRALRGVPPVLNHLLASTGHTLVSDAIVARLRGMLNSIATQLLEASNPASQPYAEFSVLEDLADHLAQDSVVLSYCYALAVEGQIAEQLLQRSSIDPVLSPLMQELIASETPATSELAMTALAAQSRFIQSQRRMELPLAELPAELFHTLLKRWDGFSRKDPAVRHAIARLKAGYDEGASRVGLLARVISAMRGGAVAALELEHAGLALFVSALSALSKQPRELAILACHEKQAARLVLSLRAAGMNGAGIERQFMLLEPVERLPSDLENIAQNRAAEMLKHANARNGG